MDVRRCSAVLLSAALVLAGCSSAPDPSPSNPPLITPTPSPTAPPTPNPTASASAAALTAYLNFRAALVTARKAADPYYRGLATYSVDKALAKAVQSLFQQRQAGVVYRGKPVFTPVVDRVDLSGEGFVYLSDCVDDTHWIPVYKATGKSAEAPGQNLRIPGTAVIFHYAGRWVVRSTTSDRSRTC